MDAKRFGAFISERRKEHHMTQADLAGKVGVTDKAVSRWERGLGFPDINTMEPLAEANIINLRKKWKGICSQVPFIVLKYRQGCI